MKTQNTTKVSDKAASKAMEEKLEQIIARHKARIAQAKRLEDNRERKLDTRYKIVLGACVIAGIPHDPKLGPLVEEALKRNLAPRDQELLRSRGWDV